MYDVHCTCIITIKEQVSNITHRTPHTAHRTQHTAQYTSHNTHLGALERFCM